MNDFIKKNLKYFSKSPRLRAWFTILAVWYLRFVYCTTTWRYENESVPKALLDAKQPFIVAFWHGRLSMMAFAWRHHQEHPFVMLLSSHRDGQLIGRMVERLGIQSVAGSTTRQGKEAVLKIIKLLKKSNTVGITPDGPRGPNQTVADGVIHIARLSGAVILPATFSKKNRWHLKTWDRFLLPLPFGRGVFLWGDPVVIPKELSEPDMVYFRVKIETAMNSLQDTADSLGG